MSYPLLSFQVLSVASLLPTVTLLHTHTHSLQVLAPPPTRLPGWHFHTCVHAPASIWALIPSLSAGSFPGFPSTLSHCIVHLQGALFRLQCEWCLLELYIVQPSIKCHFKSYFLWKGSFSVFHRQRQYDKIDPWYFSGLSLTFNCTRGKEWHHYLIQNTITTIDCSCSPISPLQSI